MVKRMWFSKEECKARIGMTIQNNKKNIYLYILILCIAVVLIFWLLTSTRPLFDMFAFRQCQTAMSAFWFDLKNPIQGLFYYQTPEFGEPWMIPFEFPIYQALVAGITHHTGLPLTVAGRMLSGIFLLLSLCPLNLMFKCLKLGSMGFFFSAIFLIFSPLYLYWGRSFMIESTAVFFGLCFVALVCLFCSKWNMWIGLAALACGILCALVKATTFPSFGVAACLSAIAILFDSNLQISTTKKMAGVFLSGLGVCICIVAALLWTKHADELKSLNPIAAHLDSSSLSLWNYGPLEQRFSLGFWKKLVWERAIPEAIGSVGVLLILPFAFIAAKSYKKCVLVCLIGLFLLPMLLFSNLHIIHSYYQYANSFWLILSIGIAFGIIAKQVHKWVLVALALGVVSFQLYHFSQTYYIHTTWKWHWVMELGKKIDMETPKNSAILVVGDEWSPEVAFYSKRKAIYIPNWVDSYFDVNEAALVNAMDDPKSLLGDLLLSAIVVRDDSPERTPLPLDRREALGRLLSKMGPPLEDKRFRDYKVYLYQRKVLQ
jgi:hypothetical protein